MIRRVTHTMKKAALKKTRFTVDEEFKILEEGFHDYLQFIMALKKQIAIFITKVEVSVCGGGGRGRKGG